MTWPGSRASSRHTRGKIVSPPSETKNTHSISTQEGTFYKHIVTHMRVGLLGSFHHERQACGRYGARDSIYMTKCRDSETWTTACGAFRALLSAGFGSSTVSSTPALFGIHCDFAIPSTGPRTHLGLFRKGRNETQLSHGLFSSNFPPTPWRGCNPIPPAPWWHLFACALAIVRQPTWL